MSAFIVSPELMQRVVSAMDHDNWSCEALDNLGRDLHILNVRAVQQRYPDTSEEMLPGSDFPEDWQFKPNGIHVDGHGTPLVLPEACDWVKALHCFRYQCHEGDVPDTVLYETVTKRIRILESAIVSRLPEYEAAEWD